MTFLPLILVGLLIIIGAVILVVVGIRSPKGEDPLQDRLADFAARGEQASLEEIELSQPFSQRVVMPIAKRFGDLVMRFTPQNSITQITKKLELAGNPGNLDPALFFVLRFLGLPLGALFVYLDTIAVPGSFIDGKGFILGIITDTAMPFTRKLNWFDEHGFGRVWDVVISSKEIGVRKPAPSMYEEAIIQTGLKPEEAVFVGHKTHELVGARAVGFKTIAFNYDADAPADVYIENFSDLLQVPLLVN